jgi:hypothetical protein
LDKNDPLTKAVVHKIPKRHIFGLSIMAVDESNLKIGRPVRTEERKGKEKKTNTNLQLL